MRNGAPAEAVPSVNSSQLRASVAARTPAGLPGEVVSIGQMPKALSEARFGRLQVPAGLFHGD